MDNLKEELIQNAQFQHDSLETKIQIQQSRMKYSLNEYKLTNRLELSDKIKPYVTKHEHDNIIKIDEMNQLKQEVESEKLFNEAEIKLLISQRNIYPLWKIKEAISKLEEYKIMNRQNRPDVFNSDFREIKDRELTDFIKELNKIKSELNLLSNNILDISIEIDKLNTMKNSKIAEIHEINRISLQFPKRTFSYELFVTKEDLYDIQFRLSESETKITTLNNQKSTIMILQKKILQSINKKQKELNDHFHSLRDKMISQMIHIKCRGCGGNGFIEKSGWMSQYPCNLCCGGGIYQLFKMEKCKNCENGDNCMLCLNGYVYYID